MEERTAEKRRSVLCVSECSVWLGEGGCRGRMEKERPCYGNLFGHVSLAAVVVVI